MNTSLGGAPPEFSRYSELLSTLLSNRGIQTFAEAEKFLNPDYVLHTHDPFLMKDMEKAVTRVLTAIKNDEKIMIYSDFDCDGIPAGVILHDFFKKIGFKNFSNYFPHRHDEGFGFHKKAVEKFAKDGVNLIITADCGISDVEAVESANSLGIDVIVTDHHLPSLKLPPAHAILNAKQEECRYPDRMLCGSAVVFKLIQAILSKNRFGLKEGAEKWFLDMVGLATLGDMVPLNGENRVFAYYGLAVLRKSPRLGLMKLLQKLKINQKFLSEDDITFMVVPRVNAASRMATPMDAFRLLTAEDDVTALSAARYLNEINDERKISSALVVKEAKKHIEARKERDEKTLPLIVIGNPNWKPSLLGPVANNLMETYKIPVFLWGRGADGNGNIHVLKGSCRSDGAVSVLELMEKTTAGTLLAFGGHRASGGFSVSHEKIHFLEEELVSAFEHLRQEKKIDHASQKEIKIDKKMTFDDVHTRNYGLIEKLAPFGEANPKPLFLFENARVMYVKKFGKEKNHLELGFARSDGSIVKAIGFFSTPDSFSVRLETDARVNLLANMEKSYFGNMPSLRLRIVNVF